MTRDEAKAELEKGKKVSHKRFYPDEFVVVDRYGTMKDEFNNELNPDTFWKYREDAEFDDGWLSFD